MGSACYKFNDTNLIYNQPFSWNESTQTITILGSNISYLGKTYILIISLLTMKCDIKDEVFET